MAKQAQTLLVEKILNSDGASQYAAELRRFPFLLGWGRLQSPIHHLKSWRMQEAGRSAVIIPMLLRCWLKSSHVKPDFLQAVRHVFKVRTNDQAVDVIVKCFAKMASSTSLILSPKVNKFKMQVMHREIIDARKLYQNICEAAAFAADDNP
jgi:hypothetical protein